MKRPRIRKKHGPEYGIQAEVIKYLKDRGWFVERMIGNMFQMGIPDIYCFHKKYGERWIDIKNPVQYEFTKAQKWKWPQWETAGIGIWILVAASDEEYDKLFKKPNWRQYWKSKYDIDLDALLEEMDTWAEDEDEDE